MNKTACSKCYKEACAGWLRLSCTGENSLLTNVISLPCKLTLEGHSHHSNTTYDPPIKNNLPNTGQLSQLLIVSVQSYVKLTVLLTMSLIG